MILKYLEKQFNFFQLTLQELKYFEMEKSKEYGFINLLILIIYQMKPNKNSMIVLIENLQLQK